MNLKIFILGAVSVVAALSACVAGPSTPLPPDSTSPGFQMPDTGFDASKEKTSELTEEEEAARRSRP